MCLRITDLPLVCFREGNGLNKKPQALVLESGLQLGARTIYTGSRNFRKWNLTRGMDCWGGSLEVSLAFLSLSHLLTY